MFLDGGHVLCPSTDCVQVNKAMQETYAQRRPLAMYTALQCKPLVQRWSCHAV